VNLGAAQLFLVTFSPSRATTGGPATNICEMPFTISE